MTSELRTLSWLLAAATTSVAPLLAQRQAPEPEPGVFGMQPPPVTDVRWGDARTHDDQVGGNNQSMLGLAAARGGGFAAVWRDQRDGTPGLYVGRLRADAQVLAAATPAGGPHTARRLDPSICVRADGRGAVCWSSVIGGRHMPFIQFFAPEGGFIGTEGVGIDFDQPDAGMEKGIKFPAVIALSDRSYALAWTHEGDVWMRRWSPDLVGVPQTRVGKGGPAAESPLWLADGGGGRVAVAWFARGENRIVVDGGATEVVSFGKGKVHGLESDPAGGFFALVSVDDRPLLRHLDARGAIDRPDVAIGASSVADVHFAVHGDGLVVLVEPGSGASGAQPGERGERAPRDPAPARGGRGARERPANVEGAFELLFLDAQGAPRGEPLTLPVAGGAQPSQGRIASNGELVCVGWTDARAGNNDVYVRAIDPRAEGAARVRDEMRWNDDGASSDQLSPAVAASGSRGVVVWADRRADPTRVYARTASTRGLEGAEIALPLAGPGEAQAPTPTAAANSPAVGMSADGTFCAMWRESTNDASQMFAQVLAYDGSARSRLLALEDAPQRSLDAPALASREPSDTGWLAVWTRSGGGAVVARAITAAGELSPTQIVWTPGKDEGASTASLARLDDGRFVVAWTVDHAGKPTLRLRFVDVLGKPRGEVQSIDLGHRGIGWDPAVCAGSDGGFFVSWTSGARDDLARDAVVRRFDRDGKPDGPILTPCVLGNEQDFSDVVRLSDGSILAAWEDDISGYDQTYCRRIAADGWSMGTRMLLNELETTFVIDRVAPRVAVMGDGFLAAWGDRRRSKGLDVYAKYVGPRFDEPAEDAK